MNADDRGDRALWNELQQLPDLHYARLEPRFGACPICLRGATGVSIFPPVTWAVCEPCGVRWSVGVDVLAIDRERVDEDFDELEIPASQRAALEAEALSSVVFELAQFHQLEAGRPRLSGVMMAKSQPTIDTLDCDPRTLQPPRQPQILPNSTRAERVAIVDLMLKDLRDHPLPRNPHTGALVLVGCGVSNRLRYAMVNAATNTMVETVCGRPENCVYGDELFRILELIAAAQERRVALQEELRKLDGIGRALQPDAAPSTK